MYKEICKDELTISVDYDFLIYRYNEILKEFKDAIADKTLFSTKKTLPTEKDVIDILLDFKSVINDIISGKIDIFDCIPLTKKGKFSKNTSYLVKDSGLKNIYSLSNYFSQGKLQLRLVPVPYPELIEPTSKYIELGYMGDGTTMFLEIGFFERNKSNEQPILDEHNNTHKLEVKRNVYLKDADIEVMHKYIDAKNVVYVYMGVMKSFNTNKYDCYTYCRVTAKSKPVLDKCKTPEDIIKAGLTCKQLFNPIKFIKEET